MIDYEKLGFKCGLEIHVQLDTKKLFCSCPSVLRNDEPDFVIKRKLTPVAGEMGEIDVAASLEKVKNREFIYEGYNYNDCLVEADEEPPHRIDDEALKIAVQTALMLNMNVLDKVFVMRKTVVDGSNTTGFQRTALVAEDGFIDTSEGRVRVNMLSLEEDAARKIKEDEKSIIYRLDRLGIPLIELRTEPDIKSALHCQETAEKIGMITRMTGKVMRGLGTIRQDVNVSIKNGSRIEIKGVQDLKNMPLIVDSEIKRQIHLIEIKKELLSRDVKLSDIEIKKVELTPLFKNSKNPIFKDKEIFGSRLKGFAHLLGLEIQKDKRLGTELARYAGLYSGVKGIIHSDEDSEKYDFSKNLVSKKLRLKESDAFIIVIGDEFTARKALEAAFDRAKMCFKGIPEEVRNANPDNTTTFLRPIPGKARMYPETDLESVAITDLTVKTAKKTLPMTPERKLKELKKIGLSDELAGQLIKSRFLALFEKLEESFKDAPLIASAVLLGKDKLINEDYELLLKSYSENKISRDAVMDLIFQKTEKNVDLNSLILQFKPVNEDKIDSVIKSIIKKNEGKSFGAIMGDVMKEFRGKVDGKVLSDKVKKLMK